MFYKTIHSPGESLYKEKGSRFLGFALHVSTELEIKETLVNFRKIHPQAVHLCYAFRLGAAMKQYRYSDDGEPSNSAGPPIFGQIQHAEITNCLVLVVRYYGGVKLGVGGLIQAYRQTAKEAIEASQVVEREDHFYYLIKCEFHQLPRVMNWIKSYKLAIKSQNYTENYEITISVPLSKIHQLQQLADFTIECNSLAQ